MSTKFGYQLDGDGLSFTPQEGREAVLVRLESVFPNARLAGLSVPLEALRRMMRDV